jgi:ribosome-binding protein aMBF1 (putative translation factor)
MAKRQTIGENPLDGLFQPTGGTSAVSTIVVEKEKTTPQRKETSPRKQRITVQISEEVIERVKNAVYWTPGLTLASLAEEAFSSTVDKLERSREEPFSKRKEELKTGRPIK